MQSEAISVSGHDCARGDKYARQEMVRPMRTVTSSVRIRGGLRPLCPVRTAHDVPKASIPAVLERIHAAYVEAPVAVGQVIVRDVGRTGVDLVATSNVACENNPSPERG